MDAKDHLPEVVAWREEIGRYLADKRQPKKELYHNPDFVPPRNRSILRSQADHFDPVLNRFTLRSRDQEYEKLQSLSLNKKRTCDVPASKETRFNVITMVGASEEKIRKMVKPLQPHFNIITNEHMSKPFEMFVGKKRVEPRHESSDFNILTNLPILKADQAANQSKSKNKNDIIRIHRLNDFDPIRGIYKDFHKEDANRRMETEANEQKRRRKYEILPPSQKYAFSSIGNPPGDYKNLASMNFTGATNDPFTKLRVSKKHSFEQRVREKDELSYEINERRRLQKFNKFQNMHLKKPSRNPLIPDSLSNNKVDYQAFAHFRL